MLDNLRILLQSFAPPEGARRRTSDALDAIEGTTGSLDSGAQHIGVSEGLDRAAAGESVAKTPLGALLPIQATSRLARAPREGAVLEETLVYRSTLEGELAATVYRPQVDPDTPRACVMFFHGGGWRHGTPRQFAPFASLLAQRGLVSICPQYRLLDAREDALPEKAVSDARAVIRWARKNAERLGIDARRVCVGGASAGAHLALMAALTGGFERDEADTFPMSRPDALVLLNPPLNSDAFESSIPPEDRRPYSPLHLLRRDLPPTVIMHGTKDRVISFRQVQQFVNRATKLGVEGLTVVPFEGRGHGFFNKGRGEPGDFSRTAREMGVFLEQIGWLR